jgi:hypothetical protein
VLQCSSRPVCSWLLAAAAAKRALVAPVAAPIAPADRAEALEAGKDVEGVRSGHEASLECVDRSWVETRTPGRTHRGCAPPPGLEPLHLRSSARRSRLRPPRTKTHSPGRASSHLNRWRSNSAHGGGRSRFTREMGVPKGLWRRFWSWDLHKVLHTHIKLEDVQVHPEKKAPLCGAFAEPSDGLEPSTPSLPWRCSTS